MTDDIPEIQAFTETAAELHTKGISPNGKYGFEVPAYKGTIPQYTLWADTWEEAFHHSLKWFVLAEEKSQGPDEEMQQLCEGVFDKVMPRLLRRWKRGADKSNLVLYTVISGLVMRQLMSKPTCQSSTMVPAFTLTTKVRLAMYMDKSS